MNTRLFLLALLLIGVVNLLLGQTEQLQPAVKKSVPTITRQINGGITHPWWVVDRGGGRSTVDTLILQSSIGQPAIQKMSYLDTGMICESGYIPGLRTIFGSYTTNELTLADGWNMLSVPLLVDDYRKTTLFSTAISSAFSYEGSYQEKDTLKNGGGYWLKFAGGQTRTIMGSSYMLDTIVVISQWNMIGTNSFPVPVANITPIPPVTISSEFFGYDGSTYIEKDILEPGSGYWVKVSEAGKLILQSQSALAASPQLLAAKGSKTILTGTTIAKFAQEQKLNTLNFADASGKSTSLFFSAIPLNTDLGKFDLPTLPPSGFDVRFTSNRKVMLGDQKKIGEKQLFPIQISGKDPFTVSWQLDNNEHQYALQILSENSKLKTVDLKGAGQMTLNTADLILMKLVMFGSSAIEVPKEYALHQNYPNPFNPTTKIKYDLPKASKVILKVYNLLGQEVVTLLDEIQEAGYKTVEWNPNDIASGIYFYRLDALSIADPGKSFVQVKNMLLVR